MTIAVPETPKPSLRDRVFGPTNNERYLEAQLGAVETTLNRLVTAQENREIDGPWANVAEGLAQVELMLDARGWTEVFDHDQDGGLTLRQVKLASKQIRELMVGNPFVQNGSRIRNAAVWGGGVEFSAKTRTKVTTKEGTKPAGSPTDIPARIQNLMEEPRNQRAFFGNDAKESLERAAFSDGNVFLLGDEASKRMQNVPLSEITGDYRNRDDKGEILAYRRSWVRDPFSESPEDRKEFVRWYFTDLTPVEERPASITFNGKREKVERGFTMLDKSFNSQVGWGYGVPDALGIIAWSRLYKEFLVNGYVMSRALARLAFKVTAGTAQGGKNAAYEIAQPGQAGATYIGGEGSNLQSLNTAGRGYDFDSGSPLAAAMAAGLGVSLLALTANPSSATGSNAAAQTLGPVEKATAYMRRKSWEDFFIRLFRWMGLTSKLVSTWSDIEDDDVHRVLQAITLLDQLEVVDAEVIQYLAAAALNIANPGEVPEGWKPVSRRKAASGGDRSTTGLSGATGGTGQGADDSTGNSGQDHGED